MAAHFLADLLHKGATRSSRVCNLVLAGDIFVLCFQVALNTLFLIADDVLRFNKKLNDSIQPFAQRDLPGGAVQPYDLREKWLATAQVCHGH